MLFSRGSGSWFEFPSASAVGWQRRTEDCELYWKGNGHWLAWLALVKAVRVSAGWIHCNRGISTCSWLWHSQKKWLLSLEARTDGAVPARPVLVHEDVYASTDDCDIVIWQWMYIRGSVEGSLLWKLSVQDSFSLNNISTSCGQKRWEGLKAICYNPLDSFQIFQFMSREGISTAIC